MRSRTSKYAPASQRMIIHRHCHICGSALFFYIRCSLSRRENAQTFALLLVPSSFLGNYRAAHSFSLRVAMARAIVFMGAFAFCIQILRLSADITTGSPSRNLRFRDGVNFIQILMSAVLTIERVAVEISRLSADITTGSPSVHAPHSFKDGTTRRSAKLAPWASIRPRLQVAARPCDLAS